MQSTNHQGLCYRRRSTGRTKQRRAASLVSSTPQTTGAPYLMPHAQQVSRGFEPRSLDSESRVLTVTPRDQLHLMQPRWHTAAQPCTGPATSTCRAWRPRRHCPCPPAGWDACRGWMQMAGPWPTAVAAWPAGRLRSRSCGHGPVNQSGRHGARTRLEMGPPGPEQGRSRADLSRDRWIQSPEC